MVNFWEEEEKRLNFNAHTQIVLQEKKAVDDG